MYNSATDFEPDLFFKKNMTSDSIKFPCRKHSKGAYKATKTAHVIQMFCPNAHTVYAVGILMSGSSGNLTDFEIVTR